LRQELTAEKWADAFNSIKLLFQTLAKERDFEMALSLLYSYQRREKTILPHFKKFLQTSGRLTRRWSRQAALDFNNEQLQILTNSFHLSFSGLSDEQVVNKIKELAIKILKKVKKLAFNFKKNIHEIRKLLKDLYYWLKACPENPVSDVLKLKLLEKILDDMGRWQDHFIFLNKLKDFKKEFSVKGSSEFSGIKTCEGKIKKNHDELLNKIKVRGVILFLK
ncbi:MAG TPA: CHAD domain-containing protein, partial [Chitinophagaceae bacterium]|nr:CHAD domain-containing protein [Chitinophagaceae bacterium]